MCDWCNENQAYFDVHINFEFVEDGVDAAEMLTGTGSYTSPPWTPPHRRVCMEFTSLPNGAWFGANRDTVETYYVGNETNPPDDTPWNTFVEDFWIDADPGSPTFGKDGDLGLSTLLTVLNSAGFNNACYGSVLQIGAYEIGRAHV